MRISNYRRMTIPNSNGCQRVYLGMSGVLPEYQRVASDMRDQYIGAESENLFPLYYLVAILTKVPDMDSKLASESCKGGGGRSSKSHLVNWSLSERLN